MTTKRPLNFCLGLLVIILFSVNSGCKKEKHCDPGNTVLPQFYEFNLRVSDRTVYLNWHFPKLQDDAYTVEVKYNLNGSEKVQEAVGRMTISELNNGEKYKFLMTAIDKCGNRYSLGSVSATPNTPFVVISPTGSDGYSIEDGKVRIDLRFNRPADTTNGYYPISMDYFILLSTGMSYQPDIYDNTGLTKVSYSYKWLENCTVLSILTDKTKESFCAGFPCYLYLRFHFSWRGATFYEGIADKNGMQLDADKDGREMGEAKLIFILN